MRVQRAVIVALLVVVGALGSACSDDGDGGDGDATATSSESTTTSTAADGSEEAAESGSEVVISGFTYSPDTLEVSVGDTVTWTNEDGTEHTVTDEGGAFGDSLGSGDRFEFTFDEAGTYSYFCGIHPDMTGEVVVS